MPEQDVFQKQLSDLTKETNATVLSFLPDANDASGRTLPVADAMRYALEGGGKRLRPIMMRLSFDQFGGKNRALLAPFQAAIEMIHTYSLVHDDLPCMDNDDLRRGRKTTHIVYGEGMAVLAGDALLNAAYETALKATEACENEAEMLRVILALRFLADRAGVFGMVGGQCIDIETEKNGMAGDAQTLSFIHENKTAALFEAALMCGAILADAAEEDVDRMERLGFLVGHVFQITDDMLDETGDAKKLGKSTGKDKATGKLTWTSLYGLEQARADADALSADALRVLKEAGADENGLFYRLISSLLTREF